MAENACVYRAKLKAETKRLKKDLISSHSQKNKNQSSLDGTSGAADSGQLMSLS